MTVRAEEQITLSRVDDGPQGADGTTFTPSVNSDGDISWTNDGGKTNPPTQNIKGPQGIQGPQGPEGPAGQDATAEYIVGTQAAATNAWTGVTQEASLVAGKTIAYKLPYAGNSSAATLNLTLSGGGTTGAKTIYRNSNNSANATVTTQFGANSVIVMTYDGTYWRISGYDIDTIDRHRVNNNVKVAENIARWCIAGWDSTGYKRLVSGLVIDLAHPICYLNQNNISGQSYAVASGGTTTNFYTSIPSISIQNTKSGWTGTANKTIYVKGTLNGNLLTVHSDVFTTTEPASKDGYVYVPIGITYSTYQINFLSENKVFAYKGGKFQEVGLGYASAHITEIDDDGITVHADNNTTTDYLQIDSDGVDIVKGGVSVAYYGDYARVGQDGAARIEMASSGLYLYDNKGISALSAESSGAQMPMNQAYIATVTKKVTTGTTYGLASRSDVVPSSEILFYPYNYSTSQYEAPVSCTQGASQTISNKSTNVSGVTVTYTVTSTSTTDIKINATYTNASNTRVSTKFKFTYKVYADAPLIAMNGVLNINGNALTDFVVEQGVENTWTYRKWYSGKRECWATVSYTGNLSTSNGGWYCDSSSGRTIPDYPTGLFSSQPYQYVSAVCDGSSTNVDACIMGANRSLTNFGNVLLHRGSSYTTSRTYIIYMHAIQL